MGNDGVPLPMDEQYRALGPRNRVYVTESLIDKHRWKEAEQPAENGFSCVADRRERRLEEQ